MASPAYVRWLKHAHLRHTPPSAGHSSQTSSSPLFRRSYTLTITRMSTPFGDRCFQSPAAQLWNRLPPPLQQPNIHVQTVHKTAEVTIVLLRLRRCETFVQHGGTTSYLLTYFKLTHNRSTWRAVATVSPPSVRWWWSSSSSSSWGSGIGSFGLLWSRIRTESNQHASCERRVSSSVYNRAWVMSLVAQLCPSVYHEYLEVLPLKADYMLPKAARKSIPCEQCLRRLRPINSRNRLWCWYDQKQITLCPHPLFGLQLQAAKTSST